MAEDPRKRRSLAGRVWEEIRPNALFWLVSTPLLAFAAAFVGFAKKAWAVDPLLSSVMVGGLVLSLIGLLLMWIGRAEWEEERQRKGTARGQIRILLELRDAANHLRSHKPGGGPGQLLWDWAEQVQSVQKHARYWARQLPADVGALILTPNNPPVEDPRLRGMADRDIEWLEIAGRGLDEAADLLSKR